MFFSVYARLLVAISARAHAVMEVEYCIPPIRGVVAEAAAPNSMQGPNQRHDCAANPPIIAYVLVWTCWQEAFL